MSSANKKHQAHMELPLTVDAALEVCPLCGAQVGERCTKRYAGKRIATATPHPERVELVNRIRRFR